jgi:hypothetical protein
MSVEEWRPLSWRLGEVPAAGSWRGEVPSALEVPLREWVADTLRGNPLSAGSATREIAERVLLRLDLVPPAGQDDEDADDATLRFLAYGTPVGKLPDVIDAVLFLLPVPQYPVVSSPAAKPSLTTTVVSVMAAMGQGDALTSESQRRKLARLLQDALSVLRVRRGGRGLERRADPVAEAALSEAVSVADGVPESGSAGAHLRAAWHCVHALHPDPGKGYAEAIKAVEAAAHGVIQPRHKKATLGSMIGHLRDNKERFSMVITSGDGLADIELLIGCMSLLWGGAVVAARVQSADTGGVS